MGRSCLHVSKFGYGIGINNAVGCDKPLNSLVEEENGMIMNTCACSGTGSKYLLEWHLPNTAISSHFFSEQAHNIFLFVFSLSVTIQRNTAN